MKKIEKSLATTLLLLASVVSSCSSSPIYQGSAKSWYQLGYEDAMDGHRGRTPNQLYKKKKEIKTPLSIDKYHSGWKQGMKKYCKKGHGYQLGSEGIVYNNICPDNMIPGFDHAWQRGLAVFCTPHNGFKLGVSGKHYSGFCPPYENIAFQREYNRGYKIYKTHKKIHAEIERIDQQIPMTQNKNEIKQLEKRKSMLEDKLDD